MAAKKSSCPFGKVKSGPRKGMCRKSKKPRRVKKARGLSGCGCGG